MPCTWSDETLMMRSNYHQGKAPWSDDDALNLSMAEQGAANDAKALFAAYFCQVSSNAVSGGFVANFIVHLLLPKLAHFRSNGAKDVLQPCNFVVEPPRTVSSNDSSGHCCTLSGWSAQSLSKGSELRDLHGQN